MIQISFILNFSNFYLRLGDVYIYLYRRILDIYKNKNFKGRKSRKAA